MKNKKIQRLTCFLLALAFCFTLGVAQPMQAHAAVLELGWVTYVVIAYMAACGITFTAAGGIQALQKGVDEMVDEWADATYTVDWRATIANAVSITTGGGGGSGDGWFKIGVAGAVLLSEFVKWLRDTKGWEAGSTQVYSTSYATYTAYINGEPTVLQTPTGLKQISSGHYSADDLGTYFKFSLPESSLATNADYLDKTSFYYPTVAYYGYDSYIRGFFQHKVTAAFPSYSVQIWNGFTETGYNSVDLEKNLKNLGYDVTPSLIVGYTIYDLTRGASPSCDPFFVLSDGTLVPGVGGVGNPVDYVEHSSSAETVVGQDGLKIESEEELQNSTGIIIDTGDTTAETPEALAEAIQESILNDTFTSTTTITQPEPEPSPEVTPVPSPAPVEVPDVEGLGLPQLGESLLSRFPFSLPRDISRIWTLLSAEPQAPKWEVDLFGGLSDRISFVGDTSFSIDLGEYPEIGQICRWASVISFCLFLALITKSMIGW